MIGKSVCAKHGGKTPSGLASPHFKHGRYSRHLPARLMDRYREASTDPELLAMRDEIALTDARLSDLLSRVEAGEAGILWRQARTAFTRLKAANATADAKSATEALIELDGLLARGAADYAAWDEIGRMMEARRRLVESERKRLVEMQQILTAEEAMIFVTAVMEAVRRNVPDPAALREIQADLIRLTHRTGGVQPGPGE